MTYRTLRRREGASGLSDISTVIGAVGGAAVTSLFADALFGWYAVGLAIGFFGYILAAFAIEGKTSIASWMGDPDTDGDGP